MNEIALVSNNNSYCYTRKMTKRVVVFSYEQNFF